MFSDTLGREGASLFAVLGLADWCFQDVDKAAMLLRYCVLRLSWPPGVQGSDAEPPDRHLPMLRASQPHGRHIP